MQKPPVVIIGGGLAGLATATYLARVGRRVTVFEKSRELGGRARTVTRQGFRLNTGPHALYVDGAAAAVLRELGVSYSGGKPDVRGGYALRGGRAHTFPSGILSLLTTGLLCLADKLATARIMASLPTIDVEPLRGSSYRQWVEAASDSPVVRELLLAVGRLSSYANAPELMDAGAVVAQIKLAVTGGVLYLDSGWQTIVKALRDAAVDEGVLINTGSKIESLGAFDGCEIVIAASPAVAGGLLGYDFDHLIVVRAACLDLALDKLPKPGARFALGMDAPTYYSVHSHSAELAPKGGATVQLAKYLSVGDSCERAELEDIVDALQPGWRDHVVISRFIPSIVVSHALVTPAGRPSCEQGGAYIVGDWVGDEGMLADAALASARRVAGLIDRGVMNRASMAA